MEDDRRALALANEAIARQLSVRELERRVRDALQPRTESRSQQPSPPGSPVLRQLEDELRKRLQTDVRVRLSGPERGTVEIAFYSADDLERILDLVLGPNRERG
jgi:ParB family transcriptional regulator, chromosome partitioning protein